MARTGIPAGPGKEQKHQGGKQEVISAPMEVTKLDLVQHREVEAGLHNHR